MIEELIKCLIEQNDYCIMQSSMQLVQHDPEVKKIMFTIKKDYKEEKGE